MTKKGKTRKASSRTSKKAQNVKPQVDKKAVVVRVSLKLSQAHIIEVLTDLGGKATAKRIGRATNPPTAQSNIARVVDSLVKRKVLKASRHPDLANRIYSLNPAFVDSK